MLSDAEIDQSISEIDAALAGLPADAPVSFGTEMFAALVRRGLICDHLPAPIDEAPTEVTPSLYRETHPARVDTQIEDRAFALGTAARG